jgi:hypothetical protein
VFVDELNVKRSRVRPLKTSQISFVLLLGSENTYSTELQVRSLDLDRSSLVPLVGEVICRAVRVSMSMYQYQIDRPRWRFTRRSGCEQKGGVEFEMHVERLAFFFKKKGESF